MCSLTRRSTNVVRVWIALRKARGPLEPWPTKHTPFTPRSGAAPYSCQSMRERSLARAPRMNSAPNMASGPRLTPSRPEGPRNGAAALRGLQEHVAGEAVGDDDVAG